MGYRFANRKEGALPPGINCIWRLNSLGGDLAGSLNILGVLGIRGLGGWGAESSVITYINNDWNKERNQLAGPRKKHGRRNKGPGGRFPVIREGLTQVIAACPLSIDAFSSIPDLRRATLAERFARQTRVPNGPSEPMARTQYPAWQ